VALTVGTAGEGEVAEIGLNAAEHVGEDLAEEGAGNALKDAGESCVLGGESFTAGTKVLLASGKAVPIASLKPGEKVLATNTSTGKTQAETISVVMVHHDTNLYDLKIKTRGRAAVIHTTSNHPFWDVTAHRWVKAAALKYGTHLRTPAGGTATVLDGHAPRDRSGWMWDLTIPGDHDFYVVTTAADVLVHNNCGPGTPIYRGVSEGHPGYDNALEGRAVPRGGTSTPEMHQLGYTDSPYTSWSTSEAVATRAALKNADRGVVLQTRITSDTRYIDVNSQSWADEDLRGEYEVQIEGEVSGATPKRVMRGG
jgi:hypothetical protein